MPLAPEFFKNPDGIRDTAFERIDRIYQQQAIIWIDIRICPECIKFARTERHKHLHHAVSMRSLGLIPENM